ncbi:hypothetical protein V6N11_081551 [Hibiscus sabdariffa]|uniref:Uncharacterized protein n=1 Tax=Hibiscus sabdariffa TaxID=183260 RepID=A0ABR2AAI3_9ROSI
MQNSMKIPSESEELMDEEDIIIEEGEIVRKEIDSDKCPELQQPLAVEENVIQPATNQQRAKESSFGPWMVVERRQHKPVTKQDTSGKNVTGMIFQGSRFNPIRELENDVNDAQPIPNALLADVPIQHVRSVASIPRVKPRNKGKLTTTPKPAKPITLRKPLVVNLVEFPTLARNQSKASSSCHPPLDQLKHTTVVMDENLDPNVSLFPKDSTSLPFSNRNSPIGEPPDKPTPTSHLPVHSISVDTSLQSKQIDEVSDAMGTIQAMVMLE